MARVTRPGTGRAVILTMGKQVMTVIAIANAGTATLLTQFPSHIVLLPTS